MEINELREVEKYLMKQARDTNVLTSSDIGGFDLVAWIKNRFAELELRESSRKRAEERVGKL